MRRLISFIFLLILFTTQVQAQQTNWERIYGIPNRWEMCYSVVSTYDKGFLFAINFLADSSYGNTQYCSWLLKTDINGNPIWSKYFYNPIYTFGIFNLDTWDNGDVILTGQTTQVDGAGDVFIMRLNSCGEKIWCKYLHFPENNYGWMVKYIDQTKYGLLTTYASNNWQVEGNQLWVIDTTGQILSFFQIVPSYNYPYLDDPFIYSVLPTSDQGFLFTGFGYIQDTASPQQWWRIQHVLVKIDSMGNVLWMMPQSLNLDRAGALGSAIEFNNHYFTVGYTKDLIPKWYPYFSKVTYDGTIILENKMHPDTLFSTILGIIESNNSFYQAGQCFYSGSGPIFTGIFHTDTSGNLIQSMENKNGTPSMKSFTKSINNKFLVGGYTPISYTYFNQVNAWAMKVNQNLQYDSIYNFPFVYDSLCSYSIPTDTVDCDCDLITGYGPPLLNKAKFELALYPNPASDIVSVKVAISSQHSEDSNYDLLLYDFLGRRILNRKIKNDLPLDVLGFPAGIYLLSLEKEGIVLARKKLIVVH